jgi:serine/threonine-protein phosphatase 5
LKNEANSLLQNNKFFDAYDKYTEALNLNVVTKLNAILYSNRAFVDIKLEKNGLALEDANKAIYWDKNYVKAYYRRACANLCLCKYNEAMEDFQELIKQFPNDSKLIENINKTKKHLKKNAFWDCFNYTDNKNENNNINNVKSLNLDNLKKEIENINIDYNNYNGPKYEGVYSINQEFIEDVIENMKNKIYLHKKYLLQIIYEAINIFTNEPSLVDININEKEIINICGDIHGQFYDLLNIFKINGYPSKNNSYLFNGDFVDRGPFSVEVIIVLLLYKILNPKHFFLNRGNHESKNMNKVYGFENEVSIKYDKTTYQYFSLLFYSLPLAHCVNRKVLILHGGLFSENNVKLSDLIKINRFCEIPEKGLMCEMLWSDPSNANGKRPNNTRGIGIYFGPDIANKFLKENDLEMLIRSHECKMPGYEIIGNVITIFSAPNYCDQMGNKGALIQLKLENGKLSNKIIQFDAVPHPNIPSMYYSNQWMFM